MIRLSSEVLEEAHSLARVPLGASCGPRIATWVQSQGAPDLGVTDSCAWSRWAQDTQALCNEFSQELKQAFIFLLEFHFFLKLFNFSITVDIQYNISFSFIFCF